MRVNDVLSDEISCRPQENNNTKREISVFATNNFDEGNRNKITQYTAVLLADKVGRRVGYRNGDFGVVG
jgi:hypothetical protein